MRSGSPKQLAHGRSERWETGDVLLDEAVGRKKLDFPLMFGNGRPVEVEIGTGKGTFLLARASARPEINFLGIEWARAYCHYAADRFRRAGLTNARMLRADAGVLFGRCLAHESVWRVHVYFPDPWPKRRHQIRRLIQPRFLRQVHHALKPGGQLLIVTDHMDYFRHIRRVVANGYAWAWTPFPQMADKQGELVGTNFERKYIAQGRSFCRIAMMKYGRS